jgi:hypothetical protein
MFAQNFVELDLLAIDTPSGAPSQRDMAGMWGEAPQN